MLVCLIVVVFFSLVVAQRGTKPKNKQTHRQTNRAPHFYLYRRKSVRLNFVFGCFLFVAALRLCFCLRTSFLASSQFKAMQEAQQEVREQIADNTRRLPARAGRAICGSRFATAAAPEHAPSPPKAAFSFRARVVGCAKHAAIRLSSFLKTGKFDKI